MSLANAWILKYLIDKLINVIMWVTSLISITIFVVI